MSALSAVYCRHLRLTSLTTRLVPILARGHSPGNVVCIETPGSASIRQKPPGSLAGEGRDSGAGAAGENHTPRRQRGRGGRRGRGGCNYGGGEAIPREVSGTGSGDDRQWVRIYTYMGWVSLH